MVELGPESGVEVLNLRREERTDIELQLLLDAVLRYGACDFRNFNQAQLHRRVADSLRVEGLDSISSLQERVLHNDRAFATFAVSMTGGLSTLFADPPWLRAVRDSVIPLLKTYAFVRIWVASSGTGGGAYALAALLAEAGMLERSVIYATCLNDVAVAVAKAALYRHPGRARLDGCAKLAGLEGSLDRYFDIDDAHAVPKECLRSSVMLGRHNLSTDSSINEFHAVVSRGIVPLLNGAAQFRAHSLFYESLARLGFLVLGQGESVEKTVHEGAFRRILPDQPIYRRMR